MLQKLALVSAIFGFSFGFVSCSGKESPQNAKKDAPKIISGKTEQVQRPRVPAAEEQPAQVLSEEEKRSVELYRLGNMPSLTIASYSNDIVTTRKVLAQAEAKIVYDPNDLDGSGHVNHEIPFIIFEIEPSRLLDDSFVYSLNLDIFEVLEGPHEKLRENLEESRPNRVEISQQNTKPRSPRSLSLPGKEVRLDRLKKKNLQGVDGENVVVAILDTGIDVTHPFFQDRVVYAADLTEEGRAKASSVSIELREKDEESKIFAGDIDVSAVLDFESSNAESEDSAPSFENFEAKVGLVSERVIAHKSLALEPSKLTSVDINQDGDNEDSWTVVFLKTSAEEPFLAYVDYNNDGVIQGGEEQKAIQNFNSQSELPQKKRSFFTIRHATKSFQYPLIFDFEKHPEHFTFFADFSGHGTHVAGTVGGRDEISGKFSGVAPNVKFMAIKVLGSQGGNGASVPRGIVESVINSSPYKADIVNLSLGSSSMSGVRLSEALMRDLANTTGAIFVVAAGNSGPGFHSINGMGKYGPIVSVGAYLSDEMLKDDYVNPARFDPEGQVYHFSSRGPSYTGELRPNIVAPGGLVSSVPLGGVGHKQGTSMATPLTTGVMASVLSALKAEGSESSKFWDKRREVFQKKARHSLTFLPMTVRQALQDSASPVSGRSLIEQGYGLIQADKFYDKLKKRIEKEAYIPTDLVLNGNQATARAVDAYRRDGFIEPNQIFSFTLPLNSRLSHEEQILLRSKPLSLELKSVWKQGAEGNTFEEIKDQRAWPFYIFTYGDPDTKIYKRELNWASDSQDFFRSARDLDGMETGTTYMAHYKVMRENEVLSDIVDVVHKPIHLSSSESDVYSPLERQHVQQKFAYGQRDRSLKASEIDRYFVHVPEEVQEIQVEFALETQGMIGIGVMGPSGWADVESFLYWDEKRRREIKTQNLIVPAPVPGVYEIVVNHYQSAWTTPIKYSMLLKGAQSKISHEKVVLSKSEKTSQNVTLLQREAKQSKPTLTVGKLYPFEIIENIETFALHETLVSFDVSGGTYFLELIGGGWGTRLFPKIYSKDEDGYFFAAAWGVRKNAREMKVALPEGRYFVSIENTNLGYSLRENVTLHVMDIENAQDAASIVSIEQSGEGSNESDEPKGDLHSFRLSLLPDAPGGNWSSQGAVKWGEHQRSFDLILKD